MSTNGKTAAHGRQAGAPREASQALREVARRGIHCVSHVAEGAGALMAAAMLGEIESSDAHAALRGGQVALKSAEHLVKHGNTELVQPRDLRQEFAAEEAELLARLQAVRERRGDERVA